MTMTPLDIVSWLSMGGWCTSLALTAIGQWMQHGHPDARLRAAWDAFEGNALGCAVTFAFAYAFVNVGRM